MIVLVFMQMNLLLNLYSMQYGGNENGHRTYKSVSSKAGETKSLHTTSFQLLSNSPQHGYDKKL